MVLVVLGLHAEEVVEHASRLVVVELVDSGRESRVDEERSLASDGVGPVRALSVRVAEEERGERDAPDDRVRSLERIALVQRTSPRLSPQLEPVEPRLGPEALGVVNGRQAFKELLVGGSEAVVGGVVGRPEGAAKVGGVSCGRRRSM